MSTAVSFTTAPDGKSPNAHQLKSGEQPAAQAQDEAPSAVRGKTLQVQRGGP